MAWRHLLFGLALAPTAATAATYVSVESRWGYDNGWSAESDEHPDTSNAPVVSGRTSASADGGSASVAPQPLGCVGPPGCNVAIPGSGAARAYAEANGEAGVLRARTVAYGSDVADVSAAGSKTEAIARITDTITFNGAPVVEVDLDYSWFLGEHGSTGLIFRLGAPAPESCPNFNPECTLADEIFAEFQVSAYDDPDTPRLLDYSLSGPAVAPQQGASTPDGFSFSVDLSPLVFPPFPFPASRTQTLFVELLAYSEIGADSSAGMIADNSAFLKIADYTSASGYSYAGRGAVAPVPEPSTWAALVIGFAGAGAALRRRRAQPS